MMAPRAVVASVSFLITVLIPSIVSAAPTKRTRPRQDPDVALSTTPITIVYPTEGLTMAMASGEVVLGAVSHPFRPARLNGQPLKPHRLGGFIAFPSVSPGTFTITVELDLAAGTTSLTRTIYVTPPLTPAPPGTAQIDPEARLPAADLELRPGDLLTVQMKGTPGGKAEFGVAGSRKRFPMAESNPALGIYTGVFQLSEADQFELAEIDFFLKTGAGTATAKAKGRVTVRDDVVVAVVRSSNTVVMRTAPSSGYMLYPTVGTRLWVTGRQGGEARVRLSPSVQGWVDASNLTFLPAGTPPPRATLSTIKSSWTPEATVVTLSLTDVVPFEVEETADASVVNLRLYNTAGYTNWMVYDSTDTFVKQIRWRQEDEGTALVTLELDPRQRLWGYHTTFENGALRLELRRPPELPQAKGISVFKDRAIVIDAGHQPSSRGSAGPRSVLEKDVNLAIAKLLEDLLRKEGAKPIMTRAGDDEVNLNDRPKIAWERKGELFVSVHNNAIPDGEDPFSKPRGYSVFYFHPHSFEFGSAIQQAYRRRIPLADEGLRYGNLLVARMTQMPAVLTESAYMIYPEQEALLESPGFQRRLARTLFEGLHAFLAAEQARQARAPRAAAPPAPAPHPDPAPELEQKARSTLLQETTPPAAKPKRRRKRA